MTAKEVPEVTWTAREKIHLPFIERGDEKPGDLPYGLPKAPGDKITKAEMQAAQQSDEDIASLVASGAIEEG